MRVSSRLSHAARVWASTQCAGKEGQVIYALFRRNMHLSSHHAVSCESGDPRVVFSSCESVGTAGQDTGTQAVIEGFLSE